jgi:hypothetical protein
LDNGPSKGGAAGPIMLFMNPTAMSTAQPRPRTATNGPPARRLVLVPANGRGDELVRRYRLARLRLEPRETRGEQRFAHLKRTYD